MICKFRRITAALSAVVITLCCTMSFSRDTRAAGKQTNKDLIEEIAILVNEAREAEGLPPLYLVPSLCETATVRANECVSSFSHTRPNGSKSYTVLEENKIPYMKYAENIAAGGNTAKKAFEQWKNSPAHWSIIMSPAYTHLGVGVAHEKGSLYGWYWVQTFVTPPQDLEGQKIIKKKGAHEKDAEPLDELPTKPEDKIAFAYGDINRDGIINDYDYIDLLNYVSGNTELDEDQLAAGDVLKDDVTDIADVLILREYILGNVSQLPVMPDMIGTLSRE